MMRRCVKAGVMLLLVAGDLKVAPTRPAWAVDLHPSAASTAASFLKIGVGARPAAMGGAYAAVADDASAIYWNPAGLALLHRREITAMHAEWLQDVRYEFAAYAHPLGGSRTVAMGGSGLWFKDPFDRRTGINEEDAFGFPSKTEGTFQASNWAAQAAYAQWLTGSLAGGVTLKYIKQTIDDASGGAVAADLGVMITEEGAPFRVALGLQNVGTAITLVNRGFPLPLSARMGGSYALLKRKLLVAAEALMPRDNFPILSLGVEVKPVSFAALRAGYRYRWFGADYSGAQGLTAGAGLTYHGVSGDYAFVPGPVGLGSTHRISLTIRFGPTKN